MDFKLQELFTTVLNGAIKFRRQPQTVGGQEFWRPIKDILEKYDGTIVPWKQLPSRIVEKHMKLPEYTIDGYGNKEINEINHFLIQLVRLPMKEKASVRKIIQVALNAGQFLGSSYDDHENFMSYVVATFSSEHSSSEIVHETLRLDSLMSYIGQNDIAVLDQIIADDDIEQIKKYIAQFDWF